MANDGTIADDIRRFILTSIPSVPYLEAMLLVRSETARPWDSVRLAQRLYMPEKAAATLLTELNEAGILQADEESPVLYRFAPATGELQQMIDRLAVVYSAHLVEVTNLIHSKTSKKAQQFADAFKWRKDS